MLNVLHTINSLITDPS